MKRVFVLVGFLSMQLSVYAPISADSTAAGRYRIIIAGIAIESSTFSPAKTNEKAFHAKYGANAFTSYPFLGVDSPLRARALWMPTVVARALPGGIVTREAYESLLHKTLDSIKALLPCDGVYLDIHGAMSVEGLDDPEGDYIERLRKLVGPKTIISTSMDLHGNVSLRLAKNTDLITCYRMAPHEDALDTKKRAMTELIERLESGKGKPAYKAYVSIPVLLPGEKTSTRLEPAKGLYAAVASAANQPGIVDASLWVGYAWADEPRNHAVAMVVGDDKHKTIRTATALAENFWNARNDFSFVAPAGNLDECLTQAVASNKRPFFISDCGDNPTAGAAGDVTWTLKQLLSRQEFAQSNGLSLIYASIPGEELAEQAFKVGVGGHVKGYTGALVDHRFAGPVLINGTVLAVSKGDPQAEIEAVIQTGSMKVIVTKIRKSYRTDEDFKQLGLNIKAADIVVVKLGYLDPDLYKAQAAWMLALTPGGANQDLVNLKFKRINRPMFPFDKHMSKPVFRAKLIPLSDK